MTDEELDAIERRWDRAVSANPAHIHKAKHDINALIAELRATRAERDKLRSAKHRLSEAYVRLRALIPGAFDTPTAPSSEVIWETTEKALERLITQRDAEREACAQIADEAAIRCMYGHESPSGAAERIAAAIRVRSDHHPSHSPDQI